MKNNPTGAEMSIILRPDADAYVVGCCLNALCSQTYTNWQALILDRGEHPEVSAVCRNYAALDRRICCETDDSSQLICKLTGSWVLLLGGRDCLAPRTLEQLTELARESGRQLVACDVQDADFGCPGSLGARHYGMERGIWRRWSVHRQSRKSALDRSFLNDCTAKLYSRKMLSLVLGDRSASGFWLDRYYARCNGAAFTGRVGVYRHRKMNSAD